MTACSLVVLSYEGCQNLGIAEIRGNYYELLSFEHDLFIKFKIK